MGGEVITPLNYQQILAPILPALATAAASTSPATGLLPLLSPILRQRVQLFSSRSAEPWLGLLCYDVSKAARLGEVVRGSNLEPHPVSGEVEIDWGYDAQTRYKRMDKETFQAFVVMESQELCFKLVWCINDEAGGGDGWRIGEVSVPDQPSPFADFGGFATTAEAEQKFKMAQLSGKPTPSTNGLPTPGINEDNDDSYWAQYDATPSQTPSQAPPKPSPGPQAHRKQSTQTEDEAYFDRYDEVQPAMDNHDPDEEMNASAFSRPPLGLDRSADTDMDIPNTTQPAWKPKETASDQLGSNDNQIRRIAETVHHPRPNSSASSGPFEAVNRLEATAGLQEQSEFGVKQHISRSIRSLFMLSQASGIDREEFEQLVRTELDLLGMMEEGS